MGKPVPGYNMQILDNDGNPAPAGALGNFAIKLPLPPGKTVEPIELPLPFGRVGLLVLEHTVATTLSCYPIFQRLYQRLFVDPYMLFPELFWRRGSYREALSGPVLVVQWRKP